MPGMDCPAEEQMIRMALAEGPALARLDFDLERRELTACHADEAAALLARLAPWASVPDSWKPGRPRRLTWPSRPRPPPRPVP